MSLPERLAHHFAASTHVHLVLGGAKSRSHVIHVASFVRALLENVETLERLTLTVHPQPAFLHAPAVTAEVLRDLLPTHERLTIVSAQDTPGWTFEPGAAAGYVAVGAPGLKAWVNLRRANPRTHFAVIVTDEGIGTYGGVRQRISAQRRQGVSPVIATLKASLIASAARVLTTARWSGYVRPAERWVVREEVAREFRADGAQATDPRGRSKTAVILTQPFADMGLITEHEQLRYVRELVDAASEAGLSPLVRPHPAENPERYAKFATTSASEYGTVELDPTVLSAALVMGGPSTGLINLAGIFDIPVVWVSIPGLEHLDTDVSKTQASIFRDFLGAPVSLRDVRRHVR